MKNILENLKSQQFIGVKELSDAAVEILREAGPSQEKATVTEFPNERTVRYYLSEGLLPATSDKRSQSSVFGYEHLLTLLVIKKLQADGLPISVIKTLLADKSTKELEGLLDDGMTAFAEQQTEDRDAEERGAFNMVGAARLDEYEEAPPAAAARNDAKSFLESLLSRKKRPEPEPPAMSQPLFSMAPKSATPPAEEWRRYELAPGLELQVEQKFRPPEDKAERDRILSLIKKILRISS